MNAIRSKLTGAVRVVDMNCNPVATATAAETPGVCPVCRGNGKKDGRTCTHCEGTGRAKPS